MPAFTWPRDQPPIPASPVGDDTPPVPQSLPSSLIMRRHGILAPFRRDGKSDVANGFGAELLKTHLEQILTVRAGNDRTGGEYLWRQRFGAELERLRHMNASATMIELARTFTMQAVSNWTKAIRVTDVQRVEDPQRPYKVLLRVWYVITDSGIRQPQSLDLDLSKVGATT